MKDLYSEIIRTKTKTISTQEFKDKALTIYELWKTEIKPKLITLKLNKNVLESLDTSFENLYSAAKERVFEVSSLKSNLGEINDSFLKLILPNLTCSKAEPTLDLMESVFFLGLDTNWSSATCALQLQEVAIILVAKKKNIVLDKINVEKLLSKKIDGDLSFNDKYEAFSREIKRLNSLDMPILTTHLRKIRVAILHEGYNPQPEEKDSIVSFTIGLMKKLEDVTKLST